MMSASLIAALAFTLQPVDWFDQARTDGDVPADLKWTYTRFVKAAKAYKKTVERMEAFCLPHAVDVSAGHQPNRPETARDMNLPFLYEHFSPKGFRVIQVEGDVYVIRTSSSGISFVRTKTGGWRIYRYVDAPLA